ncbi:hypothetical protein [Actinomadura madurae]|uniref:hypothetical protein n=3 Tax=Actinomadura madurae TaxID=1993 RepID=UPI0020D21578|nr:hypothetical protein [Actinomadura madurae]MCQ0020194.1 hypothetical protein [Actinomadura madurae]
MRIPQRTLSALAALAAAVALLTVPAAPAATAETGDGCDPIDPAACLLPFPNDWYTVADGATSTGRRVHLRTTIKNALGVPVAPGEWNRADGFSPGSMLLSRVPGLDLARTGAAPVTDIGASLRDDAPIVLVDTATGERWPYWAELDANAPGDRKALIIRPARNLREGHRYAVALRDLRDASGDPIGPNAAFAKILGPDLPAADPLARRQRDMGRVLAALQANGVGRDGLYLAWDFTVASPAEPRRARAPHARRRAARPRRPLALVPRDRGQERRGRHDRPRGEGGRLGAELPRPVRRPARIVPPPGRGRPAVPAAGQLPGRPVPVRDPQIGAHAARAPRPLRARPARERGRGRRPGNVKAMASEHGFVFCATKWIGMADEDVPNVVSALADLTRFRTVADRLQQSLVNFIFLGRAMTRGFAGHKAFQSDAGAPLIDTGAPLTFDGNSQGGIMGGALTAVSPDIRRAVLGVPAMNYSTLLNRSADFPQYARVLDLFYPDRLDQQIGIALIQMLWDRGEADGYAWHMTDDPLPGTPAHRVLMHVAFGDHQVAPVAAEVEARTIGARVHAPVVTPGRSPDKVPYWGIPTFGASHEGSAMVVWDSGSPVPPLTNTPPTSGRDPHSDPRNDAGARRQKATFLTTGTVVDACGGGPCVITP